MTKSESYGIRKGQILLYTMYFVIGLLVTYAYDVAISNGHAYSIPSAKNQTATSTRIILDNSRVPIVDYGYINGTYIGPQRNPLTIAGYALAHYNNYKIYGQDSFRRSFLNNTNWLIANAIPRGNYSILEYKYPWPQYGLNSPWQSAFAQAKALQVLIKAYALTGDKKYLDTARMLLNSFFVEVKDGGVTHKTPTNGWWYEEYASTNAGSKEPRTLIGMMSSLSAIYDYYNSTHDSTAKYLFDKGVAALRNNLHKYNYNNGTSSYYDTLGHLASKKERSTQIAFLGNLYDITKERTFKLYHDRWQSTLESGKPINVTKTPTPHFQPAYPFTPGPNP